MVTELGHFSLVLSFSLGLMTLILSFRKKNALLSYLSTVNLGLISLAFFCLILAFARSDFSVQSVAFHSHSTTPLIYKIAATWGHHEGSMLLWCFFLGLIINFFSTNRQKIEPSIHSATLFILHSILVLFLAYSLLTSNPFERLMPFPINRGELNPLLQDPSLTFHPLFLYMGFLSFSVPFALSIASSLYPINRPLFIQWTKPWIAGAWGFLTLGILTGSIWAYYELGWGGWWFWDPVESASLLPWLVAAALIHLYKKPSSSDTLSRSSVFLTSLGFLLCLTSVWVIRGGALVSVHTFALSPNRSFFLFSIFALCLGASILALIRTSKDHHERRNFFIDSAVFIFLYLLFIVLWGIFFPIFFEKITGQPITMGTPYFTKLFCYPMLLVFFLMGVGPFFSRIGLILCIIISFVCFYIFWPQGIGATSAITLSVWLISWTILYSLKNFRKKSLPLLGAHLGIGILALGISVNGFFQKETMAIMEPGEKIELPLGNLTFDAVKPIPRQNHLAYQGTFSLKEKDHLICVFNSERRLYFANQSEHSEATLCHHRLTTYSLILGETTDHQHWVIRFYENPFILLIWIGGILVALSALLLCFQKRLLIIFALGILSSPSSEALIVYHPKATALFKKIPCPTCPGQNLESSQTELSQEIRDFIDQEIRKGKDEEIILKTLETQFHMTLLPSFPYWILWGAPLLFLGGILLMIYRRNP